MNELALFNNFMDDVFGDNLPQFNFTRSLTMPKVDVKENKDSYVMNMDLPGMTEKDVNVELDHNVLTISSKKEEVNEKKNDKNEKDDGSKWLIKERHVSEFSRSFTLPTDANGDNVAANFKNGVLTVNIPRKPIVTPKKIEITAA